MVLIPRLALYLGSNHESGGTEKFKSLLECHVRQSLMMAYYSKPFDIIELVPYRIRQWQRPLGYSQTPIYTNSCVGAMSCT
jgi:hypothetical protein